MTSILDYQDRTTCVIFGDGGGGVLLEPSKDETGILDSILHVDGSGSKYLTVPAGGSLHPASKDTVDKKMHYVYQDGKTVFKFAVTKMADVSEKILKRNNLTGDDIQWLVPHQANNRIIEATSKRMNLPDEKVMKNIHKYGNTTSATLPLCLFEYENKLKKGDKLVFAAFGGGFTWGAMYLTWSYDS